MGNLSTVDRQYLLSSGLSVFHFLCFHYGKEVLGKPSQLSYFCGGCYSTGSDLSPLLDMDEELRISHLGQGLIQPVPVSIQCGLAVWGCLPYLLRSWDWMGPAQQFVVIFFTSYLGWGYHVDSGTHNRDHWLLFQCSCHVSCMELMVPWIFLRDHTHLKVLSVLSHLDKVAESTSQTLNKHGLLQSLITAEAVKSKFFSDTQTTTTLISIFFAGCGDFLDRHSLFRMVVPSTEWVFKDGVGQSLTVLQDPPPLDMFASEDI